MEISDVLNALEELKNGLVTVKSANKNVEQAAAMVQKICETFGEVSSQLEGFPQTVMDPIQGKIAEITKASSRLVGNCTTSLEELCEETKRISESFGTAVNSSCNRIQNDISEFHREIEVFESKSLQELRTETKKISESFGSAVNSSCSRIQNDINEFHREIEVFESMLSRVVNRVEEKTDGVVSEIRKMAGNVRGDLQTLSHSQNDAAGVIKTTINGARLSISDELVKTIVRETGKVADNVVTSKDEILLRIKKISESFNLAVNSSCDQIQDGINEFHREIETFESERSRIANRVEEKIDGVVSEIRKTAGDVREDMQSLSHSQSDELVKTIVQETGKIADSVIASKDEILVRTNRVFVFVAIMAFSVVIYVVLQIVRVYNA